MKKPNKTQLTVSLLISAALLFPLYYLFLRAFSADFNQVTSLLTLPYNLTLLSNTLLLVLGVLIVTTLIAFPLAWLVSKTNLSGKRSTTLMATAALAFPGYIIAMAWLSLGGNYGVFANFFGWSIPRLSGYWGALIVLSLYTFPYLFLNLRTALNGLDPNLEDAARTLGYSPRQLFWKVILPQLKPALLSGWLIIGIYVFGDFGAVSLMRFETFSYAIFQQYNAFDLVYAAWLALMALTITLVFIYLESKIVKQSYLERKSNRPVKLYPLGKWMLPSYAFLGLVFAVALALPVCILIFWLIQALPTLQLKNWLFAVQDSIALSLPAAFIIVLLALPLAYLAVRYPKYPTRYCARIAYLGYSVPALALALALIFFSLKINFLYQSIFILLLGYAIHFIALAIGPLRSTFYQVPHSLSEAAYTLGQTKTKAFFTIKLPLIWRGLVAASALVFILVMKELPITFLLAPPGYDTLAMNVWSYSSEALFIEAAPYAITIVLLSSLFLGLLLKREEK